jgi:hypothetical protein
MNRSREAWLEHEHIRGYEIGSGTGNARLSLPRWYGALTNRPRALR